MRTLALTAVFAPLTASAVPLDLTHSGRLLDSFGTPITGTHTVDVGLYPTATATTADWSTSVPNVSFDDGYYTVTLAGVPASVFAATELWVGIGLDGGAELSPRLPLSSVPWSIRAGTADDLAPPTGCASDQILTYTGTEWACRQTVQLGDDPSACSSANAGTLRWSGASLDVCTGTGWEVIKSSVSSIPDMALWVRADAGITFGGGTDVATWADQSGNNRNFTQTNAARQPNLVSGVLNGLPVIRHTAANNDTLTVGTNFGAPNTVIYLARMTGGVDQRILSGLNNNWLLGFHGGSVGDVYHEGWINNPTTLPGTGWYVFTSSFDGTTTDVWQNRTQIVSGSTAGTAGPAGLATSGYLGQSEFSNCDIAEIFVFSRVLTASERDQVWTYLESKYNL